MATPQHQSSGAAGNNFGHTTAPKIAKAIGATMTRKGSNEASLNGQRIVIKSAGPRTSSVGVSKQMLKKLHAVFGAFQREDGAFEIISLPANIYEKQMTPTRSTGPSAGLVGIVGKAVFLSTGTKMATVKI